VLASDHLLGTGQISDPHLLWRWRREWILREQLKKALGLWLEVRGGDLLRVFLRLLGENDDPTHQPGLAEDLYSGSAMSFRIESRIPGIETR